MPQKLQAKQDIEVTCTKDFLLNYENNTENSDAKIGDAKSDK